MRKISTQPCERCKAMVPTDKRSCPLYSKDTFGHEAPSPPQTKAQRLYVCVGIGVLLIAIFAFWIRGTLVSMKAYDLQAVPREQAEKVQEGMTHRQVIDLLGRDAAPIPVWNGFESSGDQSVRAISESAQASLESHRMAACNPDRDDACGAHYTLKGGSGLRLIYRRGVVIYAAISSGYDRRITR